MGFAKGLSQLLLLLPITGTVAVRGVCLKLNLEPFDSPGPNLSAEDTGHSWYAVLRAQEDIGFRVLGFGVFWTLRVLGFRVSDLGCRDPST